MTQKTGNPGPLHCPQELPAVREDRGQKIRPDWFSLP